jgi:uncharacterized protein (DUF697 family)
MPGREEEKMPSLKKPASQTMGAIGTVRNFASVLREISFDEIRDEALKTPRLLILAPDEQTGSDLALDLTGLASAPGVTIRDTAERIEDLDRFDAIVVYDPANLGAAARIRDRATRVAKPLPVIDISESGLTSADNARRVRESILKGNLDRAAAFGRAYPAFRPSAVKMLIDEASMANAQFALVSNIPSVIPIVGSLMAVGADFLVLTKNQLMLIYKIAAVHGRDLDNQFDILREMIPVVGAGLFWRTVAREAASFFPVMAGTIPKVIIAYTGTSVAGRGMDFYYRFGKKPSKEQLSEYYRQAVDAARNLPLPLPGRNGASDKSRADEETSPL